MRATSGPGVAPASTERYAGSNTLRSRPQSASAAGRPALTSASPPGLAHGAHSGVAKRICSRLALTMSAPRREAGVAYQPTHDRGDRCARRVGRKLWGQRGQPPADAAPALRARDAGACFLRRTTEAPKG